MRRAKDIDPQELIRLSTLGAEITYGEPLPPCPKCGSHEGFEVRRRVWGWSKMWFTPDGRYFESEMDNLQSGHTRRVRCTDCQTIRKDVEYKGDRVVIKQ